LDLSGVNLRETLRIELGDKLIFEAKDKRFYQINPYGG